MDINVLGVHGESQVAVWSMATIGGIPIKESHAPEITDNCTKLANECKYRSQSMAWAEGATPFGIGSIVSSICTAILLDKRTVHPISHFQAKTGCCYSLPAILGRTGIVSTIDICPTREEAASIAESVGELKRALDRVRENLGLNDVMGNGGPVPK